MNVLDAPISAQPGFKLSISQVVLPRSVFYFSWHSHLKRSRYGSNPVTDFRSLKFRVTGNFSFRWFAQLRKVTQCEAEPDFL